MQRIDIWSSMSEKRIPDTVLYRMGREAGAPGQQVMERCSP